MMRYKAGDTRQYTSYTTEQKYENKKEKRKKQQILISSHRVLCVVVSSIYAPNVCRFDSARRSTQFDSTD